MKLFYKKKCFDIFLIKILEQDLFKSQTKSAGSFRNL